MAMKYCLQNLLYAVAIGKKRENFYKKYTGIYWPHWISTHDYEMYILSNVHITIFLLLFFVKIIILLTKVNIIQS